MQHYLSVLIPNLPQMTKVRGEPCTPTAGFQYCAVSHPPPPPLTAALLLCCCVVPKGELPILFDGVVTQVLT